MNEVIKFLWSSGILTYLGILTIFFLFRKKESLKLNLRINKGDMKLTFLIIFGLLALTIIGSITGTIKINIPQEVSSQTLITLVSIGLVVAPTEELLFRGTIQNLFSKRLGVIAGITLASTIFGLVHLRFGGHFAIAAGLTGMAMGITFQKTESIVHPIMIHASMAMMWVLLLTI